MMVQFILAHWSCSRGPTLKLLGCGCSSWRNTVKMVPLLGAQYFGLGLGSWDHQMIPGSATLLPTASSTNGSNSDSKFYNFQVDQREIWTFLKFSNLHDYCGVWSRAQCMLSQVDLVCKKAGAAMCLHRPCEVSSEHLERLCSPVCLTTLISMPCLHQNICVGKDLMNEAWCTMYLIKNQVHCYFFKFLVSLRKANPGFAHFQRGSSRYFGEEH